MLSGKWNILGILIATVLGVGNADDCVHRDFGYDSTVCVCNATYCDSASVDVPEKGKYRIYESSKSGLRMSQKIGTFESDNGKWENEVNVITLTLNAEDRYQQINGFGGAFTDSAGINMKKLSQGSQDRIIESYFGVNGSRYNIGRVPAGGTDFSTRGYSYDDTEDDVDLKDFALADEDLKYKIPFMQKALEMNPELRFMAAAWTAPPWMKTNDDYYGYGFLKKKYYQTWANYLTKFLVEYKKRGVQIWVMSTGNEPSNIFVTNHNISTMGWSPRQIGNWIANNFGPAIKSSEANDTLLLIVDDQRFNLPWFVEGIFTNAAAKDYTAGIGVHSYWDNIIPTMVIDWTHKLYPDKFLILTESCVGSASWDNPKVRLGDWSRGEEYITNIMENLNHWMTGWIDWNLALDKEGGPNWVDNFVDSPIIVNPETDEFFKQPMYYAFAHFTKFIKRGSTRIGITINSSIDSIAFHTPDNEIVLVLYNGHNETQLYVLKDPIRGNISTTISSHTIQTIIYKQ